MVDNALVQLTVAEFQSIVLTAVGRAIEPLNERLKKIESQQFTDVSGVINISKVLHVDKQDVAELLKNGCLGRAMWKKFGKGSNAKVTMIMPKGKRRFLALQSMMINERTAFCQLGADEAEAEWIRRGL